MTSDSFCLKNYFSLKLLATVDQCHTVICCHVNCTHLNKCLNIYIYITKQENFVVSDYLLKYGSFLVLAKAI